MSLSYAVIDKIDNERVKFLAAISEEELNQVCSFSELNSNDRKIIQSQYSKLREQGAEPHLSHAIANKYIKSIDKVFDEPEFESIWDSVMDRIKKEATKEKVKEQASVSTAQGNINAFNLSILGNDITFTVEEFQTPDEIKACTIVELEDNARFQDSLESDSKTLELTALIRAFGQFMPAIGHRKHDSKVISILDGSRRRCGCIKAEKPFRVVTADRELNSDQISMLKDIFQSQKELSFYEYCGEYHLSAMSYKKKWKQENPGQPFSFATYHEMKGISQSQGYRLMESAAINPCIVRAFPDQKLLTLSFFNNYLCPLVKKLKEIDYPDFELALVTYISEHISKLDEIEEHKKSDDYPIKIIKSISSKMLPNEKVVKEKEPAEYLLGSKGSKNYFSVKNAGKSVKVSAKFTDEQMFQRFEAFYNQFLENEKRLEDQETNDE